MDKHPPAGWRVLESEYLSRRPWLTVRRERLQMPNGRVIPEFYVLEYPDWVNTIAVTTSGMFVFVRQYRHGIGEMSLELCAGVRDPADASPLEAARRELLEETGYGNGAWQEYMILSPNPGSQTNLVHTFLATGVEKIDNQHLEESEDISVHLLSLDEVRALLDSGQLKQATHLAPLWKYMAAYRQEEKYSSPPAKYS
ncbi:MAG: NUDIX hydrolase [Odoribacteraceae bacterium]|jgi:ADP-ribose pyrophosphatase|nr:NUDIX hydrolase [Odoribacteraceae bacterium]